MCGCDIGYECPRCDPVDAEWREAERLREERDRYESLPTLGHEPEGAA